MEALKDTPQPQLTSVICLVLNGLEHLATQIKHFSALQLTPALEGALPYKFKGVGAAEFTLALQ